MKYFQIYRLHTLIITHHIIIINNIIILMDFVNLLVHFKEITRFQQQKIHLK
jgi:hypothetical protein